MVRLSVQLWITVKMLTLLVHGGLFECLAMKYDGRMGHGGRTVKVARWRCYCKLLTTRNALLGNAMVNPFLELFWFFFFLTMWDCDYVRVWHILWMVKSNLKMLTMLLCMSLTFCEWFKITKDVDVLVLLLFKVENGWQWRGGGGHNL